MDLSLGSNYAVQQVFGGVLDPYALPEKLYTFHSMPVNLLPVDGLLFSSEEWVVMPEDSWGFVQIRSTFARLGLICPPTIVDPGFKGNITLEIMNNSYNTIHLREGDRVCSLILVPVYSSFPPEIYNGRYQNQKGVTPPKSLVKEIS